MIEKIKKALENTENWNLNFLKKFRTKVDEFENCPDLQPVGVYPPPENGCYPPTVDSQIFREPDVEPNCSWLNIKLSAVQDAFEDDEKFNQMLKRGADVLGERVAYLFWANKELDINEEKLELVLFFNGIDNNGGLVMKASW